MVKEATKEFVENNRDLLREVVEKGDPAIRPMAAAFLMAVPPNEE